MKTKDEILELLLEKDLLTFRSDGCNKRYIDGNKFFYDNIAHKLENVYGVYYDKEYNTYVFFVTSGMHGGEIEYYSEHDCEDRAFCALYNYIEREDKLWKKDKNESKSAGDFETKKWNIASNENTPADILIHLSKDKEFRVRAKVARNPKTPTKILMELKSECNRNINEGLAQNPNCPVYILQTLSMNEIDYVRYLVAGNPNTTSEILKRLSYDSDKSVRYTIADNLNTPVEILESLSKDKDEDVRYHIAKNRNTPNHILDKLTKDNSIIVRKGVAYNSTTSIELLAKLATDEDADVRYGVYENRNTPDEIKKTLEYPLLNDKFHRKDIIRWRITSKETLSELSEDKYYGIREAVAENKNTPAEILEKLSKDEDKYVLFAVARNRNTPEETLKELINDTEIYYFRERISQDDFKEWTDTLPKAIARQSWISEDIIRLLSKNSDCDVRKEIAKKKNIPADVLKSLSNDNNTMVRMAVATNADTPGEILEMLSEDFNDEVKDCAQSNPAMIEYQHKVRKCLKSLLPDLLYQYYVKKGFDRGRISSSLTDATNIILQNGMSIAEIAETIPENMETCENRMIFRKAVIDLTRTEKILDEMEVSLLSTIDNDTNNEDVKKVCEKWKSKLFNKIVMNSGITETRELLRMRNLIFMYKYVQKDLIGYSIMYETIYMRKQ